MDGSIIKDDAHILHIVHKWTFRYLGLFWIRWYVLKWFIYERFGSFSFRFNQRAYSKILLFVRIQLLLDRFSILFGGERTARF